MDGVTGSAQENIKRMYRHTMHEMMLYTNLVALFLLTPAVLFMDQLQSGIIFCINNPYIFM